MGFKGDRRSNVFIGDFPAELPIFNAYRKSLSLEFKMDLGLEMAAKMFLRTVRNLQNYFILIYKYLQIRLLLTASFLAFWVWEVSYKGWVQNDQYLNRAIPVRKADDFSYRALYFLSKITNFAGFWQRFYCDICWNSCQANGLFSLAQK